METRSVVAAFSESPTLRETLAVLLEHDCHLRFLGGGSAAPIGGLPPDLAVVASDDPTPLLDALARVWPAVPIVSVDVTGLRRPPVVAPHAPGSRPGVQRVALDPHAIRAAVLQHLPPVPDALLRGTTQVLATGLHDELSYTFVALRACSALYAGSPGPDTQGILAAVLREQSRVLEEHVGHLERFRRRPRTAPTSERFLEALCGALAQSDELATQRGLLCVPRGTVPARAPAGPLALAPTLAVLLRAHLRRRAEPTVAEVTISTGGLSVHYVRRATALRGTYSWPLLLAALALEPWSWQLRLDARNAHERIDVVPLA